MKTGIPSLVDLATRIEDQRKCKVDLVAPTSQMEVIVDNVPDGQSDGRGGMTDFKTLKLKVGGVAGTGTELTAPLNDLALSQVAERVGVPLKYLRKMEAEAPELLATNINTWFEKKPERRMIRTLDGRVRAFLSDRYQRIDNYDVANVVLPTFRDFSGLEIRSMEITEHRLYIKASLPSLTREIKSKRVGDLVEAGVMISNSEVGLGAVTVTPFAYFLACTNGMVRDGVKRWNHVGGKIKGEDIAYLSDETVAASDKVDLMVIRDTMRHALSQVSFDGWIAKVQGSTEKTVTGRVSESVKVLGEKFLLNDSEADSVLQHLIQGGDLSQYGLMNAVTRTAEDAKSYDRATEIEAMGQRVIDLPANDWRVISEAA